MPRITTIASRRQQVEQMLAQGVRRAVIAETVGLHVANVNRIARSQPGRYPKPVSLSGTKSAPNYLPTPDEIEAACRAIRLAAPDPEPEPWLCPGWQYGNPAPY